MRVCIALVAMAAGWISYTVFTVPGRTAIAVGANKRGGSDEGDAVVRGGLLKRMSYPYHLFCSLFLHQGQERVFPDTDHSSFPLSVHLL